MTIDRARLPAAGDSRAVSAFIEKLRQNSRRLSPFSVFQGSSSFSGSKSMSSRIQTHRRQLSMLPSRFSVGYPSVFPHLGRERSPVPSLGAMASSFSSSQVSNPSADTCLIVCSWRHIQKIQVRLSILGLDALSRKTFPATNASALPGNGYQNAKETIPYVSGGLVALLFPPESWMLVRSPNHLVS